MATWWGPHAIPLDESRFWQIGPCQLWAYHRLYQWQLAWQHDANWLAPDIQVNVPPNLHRPERVAAASRIHWGVYRESVNELGFSLRSPTDRWSPNWNTRFAYCQARVSCFTFARRFG